MRYVPGIVFCLIAAAIFVYNLQTPLAPFNIPYLEAVPGVETRTERGALTWQILMGIGVFLLVSSAAFQLAKPGTEKLIHGDEDPLTRR